MYTPNNKPPTTHIFNTLIDTSGRSGEEGHGKSHEKLISTSKQKHSLRESWWDIGFDYDIGGAKSKETRSYQKGKCHSPIFSTFLGHVLFVC